MVKYFEAMKTDSLKNGEMKTVNIAGKDVLVAKVTDNFYAVQNLCPHMKAKLTQGKLEGTVLTCPKHASQFDLTDGHVIRWTNWPGAVSAVAKLVKPPRALTIYPSKIEGNKVMVEI
jgi:3-phenylpropionate/trans-cinnamate dioxygenase ferredoxin subunit